MGARGRLVVDSWNSGSGGFVVYSGEDSWNTRVCGTLPIIGLLGGACHIRVQCLYFYKEQHWRSVVFNCWGQLGEHNEMILWLRIQMAC